MFYAPRSVVAIPMTILLVCSWVKANLDTSLFLQVELLDFVLSEHLEKQALGVLFLCFQHILLAFQPPRADVPLLGGSTAMIFP